ncbi:hypothetical protein WICMUC_005170 [Wickerhamomyces mucosus]|uniref:G-protein coupled receptors family 1 profile domain-containing protein n=1 Tax=Wickerhamomyces mucosus TaxID=1378264 RepID=A0A9P8P9I6_9ASCO|nr:hypothetical protein WICMUC_005170 [Wickerhamomyces mucosus]
MKNVEIISKIFNHLNTSEVYRLASREFNPDSIRTLTIISIVSCTVSLISTLSSFYLYFAIQPTHLKFRHKLIMVLLIFDFFKALSIIIYPIITYSYANEVRRSTEKFLGFFTAASVEGNDLSILLFAIYSLITIRHPSNGETLLNSKRRWIYLMCFIIPVTMASLAFIDPIAYKSFGFYCYLPLDPLWLTLALSYIPRFFIILTVIFIYCFIYYYVITQLNILENDSNFRIFDESNIISNKNRFEKFIDWLINFNSKRSDQSSYSIDDSNISGNFENFDINLQLQINNQALLRNRYKSISRQMKKIFLYPISYILVWVFPITQYALLLGNDNNYGIAIIFVTFIPLNGLIDSLVFLYREKPWQLTVMNLHKFNDDNQSVIPKLNKWRLKLSWLPLYGIPKEFLLKPYEHDSHEHLECSNVYDKELDRVIVKHSSICSDNSDIFCNEEVDFMDILKNGPPIT